MSLTGVRIYLQAELLTVIADSKVAERSMTRRHHTRDHNPSDGPQEAEVRRVRPRRE